MQVITPAILHSMVLAGSPVIAAMNGGSGRSVEVGVTGATLNHEVCGKSSVENSSRQVRTPCLARYSGSGRVGPASWPDCEDARDVLPCRADTFCFGIASSVGRVQYERRDRVGQIMERVDALLDEGKWRPRGIRLTGSIV